MQKRIVTLAVITTATAMLLAGCSSTPTPAAAPEPASGDQKIVFVDGPQYESVEELAAEASVIVSGHFGARSEAVTEGELNRADWEGLPMELWEFVVDDVIAGDTPLAGTTIKVSQVAAKIDGAVRPAAEDAAAVLFLKPYPSGAYAIVGLGAGTIYVDDDGKTSVPDDVPGALEESVTKLSPSAIEDRIEEAFE